MHALIKNCIISSSAGSGKGECITREDNPDLTSLFEYINDARGIDFSLYRPATVARKFDLRMADTKTGSHREYLEYIKANPDELDNLIRALTIKVSNFFRNPLVYEVLNAFVLPDLISEFRFLKVWSLGCAMGEEPYSVAMLVHELLKQARPDFDVKILGTDICDGAVEKAIKGEYPESELRDVKKKYLDAFFLKIGPQVARRETQLPGRDSMTTGHKSFSGEATKASSLSEDIYRISNQIKSMVRLECGDIATRLKSARNKLEAFNLILCRNLLIYMNRTLQEEVLSNIAQILEENGYIVIGSSETIPEMFRNTFVQTFPGVKIYKKALPRHSKPSLSMPRLPREKI